jgi:hypothetical protein
MFEGLFSPWHLLIIALVTFVVIGPKALAERWQNLSHNVAEWVDDPDGSSAPVVEEAAAPVEARPPLARRLARRWARRRQRRRSGR